MKRTSRKPSELSESVHHQLNMYAMAAKAAGVGMLKYSPLCAVTVGTAGLELLVNAVPAQAKIVYTPASVSISQRVALDLNHDGINDFSIGSEFILSSCSKSHSGTHFVSMFAYSPRPKNQVIGQARSASALYHGFRIGKSGPFLTTMYARMATSHTRTKCSGGSTHGTGGQWANKGKGVNNRYLGLKFQIKGKTHFGWARLNVKMPGVYGTLTGYAYETVANKSIIAGKTKGPDVITLPATLGHLARGASGLSAWRRTNSVAAGH